MANVMTADAKAVTREEEERGYCYYLGLEDYFERLEGKDAYREFQEQHLGARDEYYYALIASLLA
jgi:hypothetical protein